MADRLRLRIEEVAKRAAENADAVDRDARFPSEAFASARAEKLLGILVPSTLGGEGASISDVVDICHTLGRVCGSTALIFAMHQIMVAIIVRHAATSPWHREFLQKLIADQMLIASSTTEGEGGGDLRRSICAVERIGARISLEKNATVLSYGAQADAIVTTARRDPEALPTDQVIVVLGKDDYQLHPTVEWLTLGMRGTCSAGFTLRAQGLADQILTVPYATIQSHTMLPVAHLTWSAVWSGIAGSAVDCARRFSRVAARRASGQLPPGAAHLTRATMLLQAMVGTIASKLHQFETIACDAERLEALDFQNAINLLKVSSSETAIQTVMTCLNACGLTGYRVDGEFSLSRCLRDVLSSPIMINNDRILANASPASMLTATPFSITGRSLA